MISQWKTLKRTETIVKQTNKNTTSALLTMPKPLSLWNTTNCGKFLKKREYQVTLPASWEVFMQVKKQQLGLGMEQQTGSKLEKKDIRAVYCHSTYLTYIQSTSREKLGWMKHKLESRLTGEISVTSNTQMTSPLWLNVKKTEEPLDQSERREWKSWF